MARKSRQARQQNLLAPTEFTHKEPENRYQTALYGRLSLQNLGIGRKETMEYQIEILREYVAKHPDLEVVDIYTDNGCSGSNFNRPEFNRMMEDVKKGRINCIVIRDFPVSVETIWKPDITCSRYFRLIKSVLSQFLMNLTVLFLIWTRWYFR